MTSSATSTGACDGAFAATRWTLVVAAGQEDAAPAMRALAELCQSYWRPLYAYVRRRGCSPEEAQDLTQEFFARLLAKNYLAGVDRAKGRFRSFLLASLKHFLANEWDRARTLKRGGGRPVVALDALSSEERARIEPADNLSPDKAFERQWALTLLDQALARLRAEYTGDGRGEQFDLLRQFIGADEGESYAAIGEKCGMSEGAVKVAVHRLRRRYRDVLREEIAQTVTRREEIDEEIRSLFAAFQ
ncbi:MAG TPA: sigma-70 family RNA polymerase sigma factor [Chthoniobacteraceae bacterium]|nr:sigma-70 family RNA polymerase sigma factor [Chthoniobacteraceae bacterium]